MRGGGGGEAGKGGVHNQIFNVAIRYAEDRFLLGGSRSMLSRKFYDPQIAGNALELQILPSQRYFFIT